MEILNHFILIIIRDFLCCIVVRQGSKAHIQCKVHTDDTAIIMWYQKKNGQNIAVAHYDEGTKLIMNDDGFNISKTDGSLEVSDVISGSIFMCVIRKTDTGETTSSREIMVSLIPGKSNNI